MNLDTYSNIYRHDNKLKGTLVEDFTNKYKLYGIKHDFITFKKEYIKIFFNNNDTQIILYLDYNLEPINQQNIKKKILHSDLTQPKCKDCSTDRVIDELKKNKPKLYYLWDNYWKEKIGNKYNFYQNIICKNKNIHKINLKKINHELTNYFQKCVNSYLWDDYYNKLDENEQYQFINEKSKYITSYQNYNSGKEPFKNGEVSIEVGDIFTNGYGFYDIKKQQVDNSDSEDNCISQLTDYEYGFQSGDCSTIVYELNNKHIIFINGGDVRSLVILKCME